MRGVCVCVCVRACVRVCVCVCVGCVRNVIIINDSISLSQTIGPVSFVDLLSSQKKYQFNSLGQLFVETMSTVQI